MLDSCVCRRIDYNPTHLIFGRTNLLLEVLWQWSSVDDQSNWRGVRPLSHRCIGVDIKEEAPAALKGIRQVFMLPKVGANHLDAQS